MVAINNNNFNDKFKILETNQGSGNVDELFAELFALINSEKEFISDKLSKEPEILIEESSKKFSNVLSSNIEKPIEQPQNKNEEQIQNELDVAKSLIQIFYKEVGIQENELKKNHPVSEKKDTIELLNSHKNLLLNKNNTLSKNNPRLNLNDTNKKIFEQKPILEFNIKKSSPKNNLKENFKGNLIESQTINNKDPKIEAKIDFKNKKTALRTNDSVNLIEKKKRKKNKQFNTSSKEDTQSSNDEYKSLTLRTERITKANSKNQNSNENKLVHKKNTSEKNDLKTPEIKKINSNYDSKIFLNLLESSWGEKFSKMLKNAINNGSNKLEIELKPKNLGKLNLEVSIKQNKTIVNLSSENQEVVNLLNENLPKLSDLIDKENRAFSSFMNNDGNKQNYSENDKGKDRSISEKNTKKKNESNMQSVKKIKNHNIDVNA